MKLTNDMIRSFVVLALWCGVTISLDAEEQTKKPNIILIFADDLGPGMLGCNGQTIVKTPHIDRLAFEGMSFSQYYGGTFCAPARWSLLTGVHDGRVGGYAQNKAGLSILLDSGEVSEEEYQILLEKHKAGSHPIVEGEVFLGQVAQQAGYKTAQFGKLDRGFLTWHERVKRFGWDHYEGMYDHRRCHGFYPPYIWKNGEKVHLPGNTRADCGKASEAGNGPVGVGGETYSQNVFLEGILHYLREQGRAQRSAEGAAPFFLYHPTQLPHGPVAIPEIHRDYVDDDRLSLSEKKYASMVKMLDDHVGLIMSELKKQGMDENTIVFFASDNGHELYYGGQKRTYNAQKAVDGTPYNFTDNKWRGTEEIDVFEGAGDRAGLKRSGYQGGIQCPLIVRWPNQIAPNQKSDHLCAHYDFLATIAEIGEVELPRGKDGISYLSALLAKDNAPEHEYVIVHNQVGVMGGSAVITKDGWKLLKDKNRGSFQLYHIESDNAERNEVSALHPERTEKLKKIWKKEMRSLRPDLSL